MKATISNRLVLLEITDQCPSTKMVHKFKSFNAMPSFPSTIFIKSLPHGDDYAGIEERLNEHLTTNDNQWGTKGMFGGYIQDWLKTFRISPQQFDDFRSELAEQIRTQVIAQGHGAPEGFTLEQVTNGLLHALLDKRENKAQGGVQKLPVVKATAKKLKLKATWQALHDFLTIDKPVIIDAN